LTFPALSVSIIFVKVNQVLKALNKVEATASHLGTLEMGRWRTVTRVNMFLRAGKQVAYSTCFFWPCACHLMEER